jgi:hypothetical protein
MSEGEPPQPADLPAGPKERPRWQPPPPPKRAPFPLTGTAAWGLVFGLLGFVFSFAYHEATVVNGELVKESYIDFGPFLMGVIVGVIGIRVLLQVSRGELLPGKPAALHKVLGMVFVGLGALHIVRGVLEIRWKG